MKTTDEIRALLAKGTDVVTGCWIIGSDALDLALCEVPALLDALDEARDRAHRAQERLDCTRCNSGHETLPLKLWDCPECVRLRASKAVRDLEILQGQLDDALISAREVVR